MRESKKIIEIDIPNLQDEVKLFIYEEYENSLFLINENEAIANGEAIVQLLEGRSYEYKLSNENYRLYTSINGIISTSNRDNSSGRITPNIYVGTLSLFVQDSNKQIQEKNISVEVLATKMNSELDKSYRENYRFMLDSITEKCTELLMQIDAPINQHYEIDFEKDNKTIYQRFAFVKSLIGSNEFTEAIQKIITSPTTQWKQDEELKDIRSLRRITYSNIRQLVSASNRFELPPEHYLTKSYKIKDVPSKIISTRRVETIDTPENRFIKHAFEVFLKFTSDCFNLFASFNYERAQKEAAIIITNLENQLNHPFFREISRPDTLKLNSPVLQRKSGYREILSAWLKFDLAAKLIWKGGDDVYYAGKRDIAVLYEYWLFFKLLELLQSVFEIDPVDIKNLIGETNDGLNIQIKQGKHTALQGIFNSGTRKLNIRFNYNRSFSGKKTYPDSGSWTTTLRPDYTLSMWPYGINESKAEEEELIVHIHFDAKYKVANFNDNFYEDNENDLNLEDLENRKGIYKNADLLKMHAYKDAIRRTGGAYVLYPGSESVSRKGFHEIIPGLGAFAVKPSKSNDGTNELKSFILEVVEHFLNRTSQREKIALKTYSTYKYPPDKNNELRDVLPETYGTNRDLIPDETFVLVGFYKSKEHYEWIKNEKFYNFRTGTVAGSLELDNTVVNARYLLLHTNGDQNSGELWKIKSKGPKIWSKDDMLKKNYPSENLKDYYVVIKIEEISEPELKGLKWDFKKLKDYKSHFASALPFTTTLAELMKNKDIK